MELRHLRYFVAVAEAENLTRAATKYCVSAEVIAKRLRVEKLLKIIRSTNRLERTQYI